MYCCLVYCFIWILFWVNLGFFKIKIFYFLFMNRLLYLNRNKFYKIVGRLFLKLITLRIVYVLNLVFNFVSFKS